MDELNVFLDIDTFFFVEELSVCLAKTAKSFVKFICLYLPRLSVYRNTTQSAMDRKYCGECKQAINDLEPMRCGFCDTFLHISQNCCGINSRGLKDAFSQGKLLLLCTGCRAELNGRSVRCYIAETQLASQVPPDQQNSNDLPMQVQQLSNIVETLSKKIDNLSCVQPQPNWPIPCTPAGPKRSVKRRRIDDRPIVQPPPECGTKNVDLSDLSVSTVVRNVEKFWLYLSGLNPLITDDDVQKIVCRCLNVPAPTDVIRLVPKGKDVAELSFVSYKISLDPDMKIKALDSSSWPVGLLFREFVNQPKNWHRQTARRTPEAL